jgi:thiosulfate/3-mercaptopyruvate sulfurtransferase
MGPRMIAAVPGTFARPELLASPDWLAENLSRSGVRVIDCRWRVDGSAPRLHAEAHIPGAVFLDWTHDLVDAVDRAPYQLAGPHQFSDAMRKTGLGNGSTAVLYDDAASLYACRVWWSLLVYGFRSVRVLDGGWPAWQASGRPSSNAVHDAEPAAFTPRLDPERRLSTSDVNTLLGSRNVQLIDVRAPAEYHGQGGGPGRPGHIPGAINIPAALLTVPGEQRFHDASEVTRLFRDAGIARGSRVITYDATGIAAAKAAFALTLLGHDNVAVYDAGWAEWSGRADLPVER